MSQLKVTEQASPQAEGRAVARFCTCQQGQRSTGDLHELTPSLTPAKPQDWEQARDLRLVKASQALAASTLLMREKLGNVKHLALRQRRSQS
jgi:hypothetical protein